MAAKKKERDGDYAAHERARGRCECTGQCGHNHRWVPDLAPERCRAPHGCKIQRLEANPSFWHLAGRDSAPLAYAELYRTEVVDVELSPVDTGKIGERLMMCQRCAKMLERKGSK